MVDLGKKMMDTRGNVCINPDHGTPGKHNHMNLHECVLEGEKHQRRSFPSNHQPPKGIK
jgi:hypothetical protein